MSNFPESIDFNLGIYVERFVDWLDVNFSGVFEIISSIILWFMIHMESFLLWLPWWSFILVVLLLGWRFGSLISGIVFSLLLILVGSFGYWDYMMMTLSIVLASVAISLLLGIPLGIAMAYSKVMETIMRPILDAMQTMPSFVYLIPAMIFFGMGKVPAVFATIIYAIPPVIRLTNLAIRRVSKEMVEAAHSFGSSPWQLLLKVQLPQALPTIMTGINQTTMMALSMVVIASMIGAQGLGMEVLISINRVDIAQGFEAGLGIVILAIIIDRITQGITKRSKVTSEN
ncbi:proline/glycine betaine ABC transporter permease [Alkalihalobacillus sp. BA299]|uniref:ABC transporter permease n=1 Tax=Alkalihalobacillus sp. BA299 TaxID=2815938 RepID=UPI001ADC7774|nr:proline/glycine betaine ABC transporter permease [Alkalihalobacillus sp. BA299]